MTEERRDTDGRTLREMSHTNPYTNETFGDTQTYNRGQFAATDGGEAGKAVPTEDDEAAPTPDDERTADDEDQTMGDVDHTPPRNAPSASAAYMEGNENAEDE